MFLNRGGNASLSQRDGRPGDSNCQQAPILVPNPIFTVNMTNVLPNKFNVSGGSRRGNPAMVLIQFGYRLWSFLQRRNKREILENTLNIPPPSRMSGSAIV